MSDMSDYKEYNDRIDYEALKWLLANMHHNHLIFKLIKAEMERRGNWKPAPKGRGYKKGYDPNRHVLPTSPLAKEMDEVEEEAEEIARKMIDPRLLRRKKSA